MMRSLLCKPTFIGYDINSNTILCVHTHINRHTYNQSVCTRALYCMVYWQFIKLALCHELCHELCQLIFPTVFTLACITNTHLNDDHVVSVSLLR